METLGNLTIGIISRNGQPFIKDCLDSFSSALPQLSKCFGMVNFILVDSNSSDKTMETMLKFSQEERLKSAKVDLYLLEGYCNAAIARNIILENSAGDFIFLCDGDIVTDPNFLILACKKIKCGQADAVVGQLAEKWYDSDFKFYKSIPTRIKILKEHNVRVAGGIIVISKIILDSGIRFDEILTRTEDWDYALRVSTKFIIRAIPEFMGTHLTQPYFSKERYRTVIKEKYAIYPGVLLRKHIHSPINVLEIAKAQIGSVVGFVHIFFVLISFIFCFYDVYYPLILTIILIILDFTRHFKNYPSKRFFMLRFIAPVIHTHGFLFHDDFIGNYTVKKLYDQDN